MQIEGRKALVLGAGKSGVESARFLAERGAIVALHDKKADRGMERRGTFVESKQSTSG